MCEYSESNPGDEYTTPGELSVSVVENCALSVDFKVNEFVRVLVSLCG